MIIAVAYDNGQIWQHFGRTEQFKFYEISDGSVTNSNVTATGGASHHALADFLAEYKVSAVICGGVGAPMVERLNSFGIKVYPGIEGEADQAVADFLSGTLEVNEDAVHSGCHHHH